MNIFLWILQALVALHTAIGAVWKFSNSEQTVPSLSAIPNTVWMGFGVVEIACAIGLILPVFSKSLGISAPISASFIVFEMLLFCLIALSSESKENSELIYWVVVAVICAFVAYGRFSLKPF